MLKKYVVKADIIVTLECTTDFDPELMIAELEIHDNNMHYATLGDQGDVNAHRRYHFKEAQEVI